MANKVYTDQLPGRTLVVNGEEFLFFSGTSYLGIPVNEQFRNCVLEGMARYGTNYSSSRNSNLQLRVFEEAEDYLATYTGSEAAFTMSSGYLAGQALVQTLQGSGYFIYAPNTHPALWRSTADEVIGDYDAWVGPMLEQVQGSKEEHIILVCNSLDPLKARNHGFSWLSALPTDKQITLVVDDSHGFGVTGEDGAGIFAQLKARLQPNVRLVVASSMGKALGIPAGMVLGDKALIDKLRHSHYFGGASPAIPAYLYAFLRCETVFKEARQKLFSNIEYFLKHLEHPAQFSYFDRYPVFGVHEHRLAAYLQERGVIISSFRYPTPADDPITRVILSSAHTEGDIQRITGLINEFVKV
ncbi:pyridoxal phosphate-dependent aminotransferase family protein [Pontibacter sp. JH31]|uniref:Pyridoxal phosphate-dependent aminotransferase family protein n=1 Tax=Pontibacter aquaedesilientis TaxID=2766980 RepID=A0ABR7XGY1_9BACT|nr:aminotransferase class I/II-fold pyridoxal phosphate-dependent enzyme [Pontibacter aquaedesilientis]MBD1396656.1 pyridoxal phosphate-dependent aminotransferase family protein [Pontibacter aquaedesilientis]